MDTTTAIAVAALVVALISAMGTVAYAVIAERARQDARDAAESARKSVEATQRLADATEEQVRLLRDQLDAERAKNQPLVRVTIISAHVAMQQPSEASIMVRVKIENASFNPDMLREIDILYGREIGASPTEVANVVALLQSGGGIRLPFGLPAHEAFNLRLEFTAREMDTKAGAVYPGIIKLRFEHAEPFAAELEIRRNV